MSNIPCFRFIMEDKTFRTGYIRGKDFVKTLEEMNRYIIMSKNKEIPSNYFSLHDSPIGFGPSHEEYIDLTKISKVDYY